MFDRIISVIRNLYVGIHVLEEEFLDHLNYKINNIGGLILLKGRPPYILVIFIFNFKHFLYTSTFYLFL